MHHSAKSTNNPEVKSNSTNPYTVSSQPWWRGIGHDGFPKDVLGESMENIYSPREPINSGLGTKTNKSHAKGGMDVGANANKDTLITEVPQPGGKFGEHQLPQHAALTMHPPSGEYLTPSKQLELVGHSIACAPYSFSDSCYEGAVPAYGPQALVHSCVGVHSARMALPLEMTEEPVYVNAKQYHGILRRRQLRAKAELEKKLIKVRKPYLHESRHLHAMRRARGCGGRFLNTKKPDMEASNANLTHGTSSCVPVLTQTSNSSSSESVPYSRSVDLSTAQPEVKEPQVHKMQPLQRYINGNGNTYLDVNDNGNGLFTHHQGFQFKYHSLLDNKVEAGDFSGQQSERTVANTCEMVRKQCWIR